MRIIADIGTFITKIEKYIYLPVPGKRRSTSLLPAADALKVLPRICEPGRLLTELGS